MTPATARLYHVDAFTAVPFAGNPAGVVVLEAAAPEPWMQAVAAELGHSETAFVVASVDGCSIRWFSPTVEVALCGHATLAAAHVLWDERLLDAAQPIAFASMSGTLTCGLTPDGAVRMDFPIDVPQACEPPAGLVEALGVPVLAVARGRFDYLVRVADETTVQGVRPDLERLAGVETRGVCVTAAADADDLDFVSRFFAPRIGIAEDPVTGSAHCMLAPYWASLLDRDELRAAQQSARGGELRVRVRGDRVELLGHAVTITRGSIALPVSHGPAHG
ncbi:MAG: PhzF family phenazine biosynthesis protein [Dehalococcoidia bacterium]